MKIYVINGEKEIGKTDFSVNLAESLQKLGRVLLLQGKRNGRSNIEDYFQKDGMITYDIADYFSNLAPLSKVLVSQSENLDFAISPLLEDKYTFTNEDINRLLKETNYDYIVIDGIDKNLVSDNTSIEILGTNNLSSDINADVFFINRVDQSYDIRNDKQLIDAKSSRFLGEVKEGEYFKSVINNLINENPVEIPKLGFFERLKAGFKK